jgi:hypothetical protein
LLVRGELVPAPGTCGAEPEGVFVVGVGCGSGGSGRAVRL